MSRAAPGATKIRRGYFFGWPMSSWSFEVAHFCLQEAIASLDQVRMSEKAKVKVRKADFYFRQKLVGPPQISIQELVGPKLWKQK